MLKLNLSPNRITLGGDENFCVVGIGATLMALFGAGFLIEILAYGEAYTLVDVFGLLFLGVWESLAIVGVIHSFANYTEKITIADDGVLYQSWLTRRFLSWEEIRDWGLSYCGQTRGEGNTYYLYFSKETQQSKNKCRKKLKGKMIKTFVIGSDYCEAVSKIIPFCKDRTPVEPFIGEDKYHFI